MLTAKLILERLDKEGRLLERREQRSSSFTKGFIQLLYIAHAQLVHADGYTITDIDGGSQTVDSDDSTGYHYGKGNLMIGAPPGQSQLVPPFGGDRTVNLSTLAIVGEKIGIQVGTGVVAVTPTDYQLSARIAHGRASGELEYGGCELIGIAFSDPNGEFTIRRYFTNASGGSITVNEVGMHAVGTWRYSYDYTCKAWAFLIARDVVSPGVAVADTEILRATYVPQISV